MQELSGRYLEHKHEKDLFSIDHGLVEKADIGNISIQGRL